MDLIKSFFENNIYLYNKARATNDLFSYNGKISHSQGPQISDCKTPIHEILDILFNLLTKQQNEFIEFASRSYGMSNFDSLTDYSKLLLDTPLYKSKFPNFAKYINEKNLNVLIFQSHDKYNVSVIDSNQLSNLSKFYKFARIKGYQLNQFKKLILTIFPTSTTSNKSLLDCFTTLDAKYNFSENK